MHPANSDRADRAFCTFPGSRRSFLWTSFSCAPSKAEPPYGVATIIDATHFLMRAHLCSGVSP